MPTTLSYPIGPLVKWGLRIIPWAYPVVSDLLDQQADSAPESTYWMRVEHEVTRTTAGGVTDDKAYVGFNLVLATDAGHLGIWGSSDFTAAETAFNTFWDTVRPQMAIDHTVTSFRWYRRRFATTMVPAHRFEDSGPPVRVTSTSKVGTSATGMPRQVATTVTFVTPWPGHWGRIYLPGPAPTTAMQHGRWNTSYVSTILAASGALNAALHAANIKIVVPVTQVNKELAAALLGVNTMQVDDIPDIQRRRRPSGPDVRSRISLT